MLDLTMALSSNNKSAIQIRISKSGTIRIMLLSQCKALLYIGSIGIQVPKCLN